MLLELGLFERATFRLRMRGNFLAAPGYLLKPFSPTEEAILNIHS